MKYVVLVFCNSPTQTKCLSEANGCTKVYKYKADASKAAKKCNTLNGEGFAKVVDLNQDSAPSVQVKDAFWHAFEYAHCHPDAMNIQAAWEQYKDASDGIS